MSDDYQEQFWQSYAENHFWRLNDKSRVKENSVYYDPIYDPILPPDRSIRIFDVGCGGGHFLYYLIRKGYRNITGIDISPGLVKFVKEEIWHDVVEGDALTYLSQHKNQFDVIVANDFIEHLRKRSIIRFLFLSREALKDGGLLFLKTPNMSNIFASRHRYVDFSHEVGFTEYSIYEVCRAAKFSDVVVQSDLPTKREPKLFKRIRKIYLDLGVFPPTVLSTNLLVKCTK